MPERKHPYTQLPAQAFWKTAVAELPADEIDLGWRPKSAINRDTGILTAGSCFAQHISKSLRTHGYRWIDAEPAPVTLDAAEHGRHGYGMFSFRTGNIYSAALLRQWVMWATGKLPAGVETGVEDGRYYDPFRPSTDLERSSSAGDILAARQASLAAMRSAFAQADLFVFTLGLTETWRNRDGTVYPMCPGTVRGSFSPQAHEFHNYTQAEIRADLAATFDALRALNPRLRFLLTVSPVPLTATAAGQHVLTATTYSKSVLRAAAGELALSREDVDYFPSYELITAPAFKGRFFEDNLRSVSPEGVAFVMRQFFKGVEAGPATPAAPPAATGIVPAGVARNRSNEEICDDIILESWANRPADASAAPPNLLLVGDSHMGKISEVLDELNIRYAGGAIMNASDWHAMRFDLDDEKFFLPHDPEQKARWESTWAAGFANRAPSADKPWLITDIGFFRNEAIVKGLPKFLEEVYQGKVPAQIKVMDIHYYLQVARRHHLGLLSRFLNRGFNVLMVTEPPIDPPDSAAFFSIADAFFCELYRLMGFSIFSAREWVQGMGGIPATFITEWRQGSTRVVEAIHGSDEYYRQLVAEILRKYPINPEYRQAAPVQPKAGPIAVARTATVPAAAPNLVLIGDSHMGMMAQALDKMNIRYAGGGIMNASDWHAQHFDIDDEKIFLPQNPEQRARWEATYATAFAPRAPSSDKPWLITNVGVQRNEVVASFVAYQQELNGGRIPAEIKAADLHQCLLSMRKPHLAMLCQFMARGFKVLLVTEPPLDTPGFEAVMAMADTYYCDFYKSIGCAVFNARDWIKELGGMPQGFREIDPVTKLAESIHGSARYYEQLVRQILEKFPLNPEYR